MFNIAIFGANRADSSMVDPGERVVSLAFFGGIELDFATLPPPPAVELVLIAVFGGINLKIRADQDVRLSGFSLFGARHIDRQRQLPPQRPQLDAVSAGADEDFDLPLEVTAYSLFGGVNVRRIP